MPTVVVTGASSGIGEACAVRLARRGWRVVAGVRRDEDAERIGAAAEQIEPVRLDVTKPDSIAAAVEGLGDEGLAGLVNNAGIAIAMPLELLPLDELRRQLEVNLVGQLAVTQALLPQLRRARAGGSSPWARSPAAARCRSSVRTRPRSTRSRRSRTRCASSCGRLGSRS